MDRDFKGVFIPKEIYLDKRLNALEKIILTEIDSLDNEEHCIASNDYLAKFCQCSEWKVSEAIKKLKELNYIEVVNFDGRHRKLESRVWKNQRQNIEKPNSDMGNSNSINIDNNIDIKNNNSSNIFEFIESNFGRTLNSIEYELIDTWEDTELTRYAIKQAVLSNHCNLKYIQSILNTYHKENIQTIQQAQEKEEQFKNKKSYKKDSWKDNDYWRT